MVPATESDVAERTKTMPEGTVAASALLRSVLAVKGLAKETHRKGKVTLPPRVRLDWTDDALTVTATDGEAWASYRIDSAVCTKSGSVTLGAVLLASVAKTVGKIEITASGDNQVRFTTETGTTLLRKASDEDWPEPPSIPDATKAWPVDPDHVRAVFPAASTESSRPILEAVAFQPGAMVATDSYRLHFIDGMLPDYPGLLIPGYALRWVAKESEPVSLSATDEARPTVRISGGAQTWIVRTVEGFWRKNAKFPEWRTLVSKHPLPNQLLIDRAEILRAIRHCMSIDKPAWTHTAPVILHVTASSVRFTRNIPDLASLETTVVAKLDGQETTIAFSGRYLRDCIAAGSGDAITLAFSDPIRPAMITDDGPCQRLLMPVRVS